MKNISIQANVAPFQLEGFPEKAKRSVKGALHLSRRATKCITEDELAHLLDTRKDLVGRIVVNDVPVRSAKKAEKAKPQAPAASVTPASPVASEPESGPESQDEAEETHVPAEGGSKSKRGKGKRGKKS